MMTEPDVTLTDYLVATESALFTYLLARKGDQKHPLRIWFAVFFGSISVAGITGGNGPRFLPQHRDPRIHDLMAVHFGCHRRNRTSGLGAWRQDLLFTKSRSCVTAGT